MTEEKRLLQLNGNRMKRAETFRTLWAVNAQPGTIKEDLVQSSYWSHIASLLNPLDRLEVRADDASFFGEYLVISCGRTWAKVKQLAWVDLVDVAKDDDDLSEYKYKYRGPHAKHSVIRSSDSTLMVEKLKSRDEALAWISEHQRNLVI